MTKNNKEVKDSKSNQSKNVKQKTVEDKVNLAREYRECYTNNPHLLELAKKWEKAGIESWLNYEKNRKKSNKN